MAKAKPAAAAADAEAATVLVELTTSMGGHNFSYSAGQLLNVPQSVADRWIASGIARPGAERTLEIPTFVEPPHVESAEEVPAPVTAAAPQDDDAGELDDE